MQASSQNLLLATAHGDRDAFATLYDRFAPRLLGLIGRILGDRSEVDDVLQEVFRELWCRADRYDPARGSPESWMILLTRSRAIDHMRRRGTTAGHETRREPPPSEVAPNATDRSEQAQRAQQGLDRLQEEQRDAVILAFFRGMTAQQIADLRDVPLGTVKTRIRLGMAKLREHMQPQHEGLPS